MPKRCIAPAGLLVSAILLIIGIYLRHPVGTIGLMTLAATWLAVRRPGQLRTLPTILALLGLAATIPGDLAMAANDGGRLFLAGVGAFTLAQCCWSAVLLLRTRRFPLRGFLGWSMVLTSYVIVRLMPIVSPRIGVALIIYALTTSLLAALAWQSEHPAWIAGAMLLLVSDMLISLCAILRGPGDGWTIPLYALSLASFTVAICSDLRLPAVRLERRALAGGLAALGCFVIGGCLASKPDAWYNPLRQMLSYLGRTEIDGVAYPPCHFWFMAGMFISAGVVISVFQELAAMTPNRTAGAVLSWGGMLNAAGLAIIALVPENVHMAIHCRACNLAVLGGAACLIILTCQRRSHWLWLLFLGCVCLAFAFFLAASGKGVIPWTPYIPTTQKTLILGYMAWLFHVCWRNRLPVSRQCE